MSTVTETVRLSSVEEVEFPVICISSKCHLIEGNLAAESDELLSEGARTVASNALRRLSGFALTENCNGSYTNDSKRQICDVVERLGA